MKISVFWASQCGGCPSVYDTVLTVKQKYNLRELVVDGEEAGSSCENYFMCSVPTLVVDETYLSTDFPEKEDVKNGLVVYHGSLRVHNLGKIV